MYNEPVSLQERSTAARRPSLQSTFQTAVISRASTTHAKTDKHLIVDDSSFNRLVLKRCLNSLHVEVVEADTGEQAILQVLEHGQFPIIWFDVHLPGKLDGPAATKELRNKHQYEGTIIGLTGHVDEQTYAECVLAGMDHFMSKPFNMDSVKLYTKKYAHAINSPTRTQEFTLKATGALPQSPEERGEFLYKK